jgi:hypothetical protein
MRTGTGISLAALVLGLGACRESDLGTGMNTISRNYSKPAEDVWKAAVKSAKETDLSITDDRHDRLGGELVALRGTGGEVRIEVKSLSEELTRVSVRVGEGDANLAKMLQERIAGALGMGEAKAGLFGGNSADILSTHDFETCSDAARCTFDALDVRMTSEESRSTTFTIDGRLQESTPVRISVEKKADRTKVLLIVGNEKSDANNEFLKKMQAHYMRCDAMAGAGSR